MNVREQLDKAWQAAKLRGDVMAERTYAGMMDALDRMDGNTDGFFDKERARELTVAAWHTPGGRTLALVSTILGAVVGVLFAWVVLR